MKEEIEAFYLVFYTLTISVLSGLGAFFIDAVIVANSLIHSLFVSLLSSTGLSMLYMLKGIQNRRYKKEIERVEDND